MDRIRNEMIRGTAKMGEISNKLQESRLKWYLRLFQPCILCVWVEFIDPSGTEDCMRWRCANQHVLIRE